jgi:spore coat polysaccharide biosynthesis protein SpsF
MLELLVERLALATRLAGVTIATTMKPADDVVEVLARRIGVGCFRGSEDNVLERVLRAAYAARADVIVEVTGDCPLVDPAIVDRVVDVYMANRYDFVANRLPTEPATYPDGFGIRVFSRDTLAEVARATDDPADREHVSLYIWNHPERYSLANVPSTLPTRYWDLRLTVDTADDFALIARIFEELYPTNPAFGLEDVLALLDRQPELMAMTRPDHVVKR